MSLLYIDIETLPEDARADMPVGVAPDWVFPDPAEFYVEPSRRSLPSSYKKLDTIAKWEAAEAERYAVAVWNAGLGADVAVDEATAAAWSSWKKGSLSPMTGRIACISMAFDDEDVEVIECAEDEWTGLLDLGNHIHNRRPQIIVAHGGHTFDYEYLHKRAMKHRMPKLAQWFRTPKPWDERLQDTLRIWTNGQRHQMKGATLGGLCKFLGIKRAPSEIDGAGVLDAYISGRWGDVVEHAQSDVIDLREVYLRLREAM